ncbi:MAG TPA: hypothetical protein VMZ26_05175 [Pyrinomonadaceae bacterium]|nr:hypothetical protein [Pyrinomonadaceae bacterium]
MFQKLDTEKYLWGWRWPIILVIVLFLLLAVQMFRVNRPRQTVASPDPIPYSTPGVIVSGDLLIPERDFYGRKIDLNKRTVLFGSFMTGSIRSRVSVIVVNEQNFERWRLGSEYQPVTETGYVPGGKVTPVLEPGTYFLVLDNRANASPQSVRVEFKLQ